MTRCLRFAVAALALVVTACAGKTPVPSPAATFQQHCEGVIYRAEAASDNSALSCAHYLDVWNR
jgi:hypothetical protein